MSLEIDVRLWWDEALPPRERFLQFADILGKWAGSGMTWTRASVRKGTPGNMIGSLSPIKEVGQILGMLPADAADCKLTAYTSLPCWRFAGKTALKGAVPLAVSFCGPEYGKTIGLQIQDEGQAQLSLLQAGPFYGVLAADGIGFEDSEVNVQVEENLDALLTLLQAVTVGSRPQLWMAFSDEGSPLSILHAHAAWFSSKEVALNKLLELHGNICNGYPPFRMPPISSLKGLSGTGYVHRFRTEEQNEALFQRMLSAQSAPPSLASLELALEASKLDSMELEEGFILLDLPFYMNAFLDEFLLDGMIDIN